MEKEWLIKKADSLSVKEKIGQLVQLTGDFLDQDTNTVITGPIKKLGLNEDYFIHDTGSILNTTDRKKIKEIQQNHLERSKHKIPLLFMADIIYGYKTIFPIPLAQACSWNFKLIEEAAAMSAEECYEEGIHVTFAPMVDIVRDPRWGRVMESPGEDTYLAELYAESTVRGLQGSSSGAIPKGHIAACVKHFAAYGAPVAGREYNAVDMSEHALREYYLPSYRKAIAAGVKLVMTAFNTLNGIPATGNQWLNRQVLRDDFSFNGVLISDYAAIEELIMHGFAEDEEAAAELSLLAGVDIDMKTAVYANQLQKLVSENGQLSLLLDEAVYRVLELKNDLGLFEDPYRGINSAENSANSCILSEDHRSKAIELAEESLILLKNADDLLPLNANQKIALIGPYANETSTLGFWAIKGDEADTVTLKQGMSSFVQKEKLTTSKGSYLLPADTIHSYDKYAEKMPDETTDEQKLLSEAIEQAKSADVIVLAVGESAYQSGEGGSRVNPELPEPQLKLIDELSLLGKPIVLVVYGGRPLLLADIESKVAAILYAWFPGTMGGTAVANIIFGKANPSGRLAMTFPRAVGQIPVFYNELRTGRPKTGEEDVYRFSSRYLDESNRPLYPFGYGQSYSDFEYTDLELDKNSITGDEELAVSITVTNTGNLKGKETVQLYLCDASASVSRPVKLLKAFKKVELNAGQSKAVQFKITNDHLKFHTQNGSYTSEFGEFIVYVGKDSSDDRLQQKFVLK